MNGNVAGLLLSAARDRHGRHAAAGRLHRQAADPGGGAHRAQTGTQLAVSGRRSWAPACCSWSASRGPASACSGRGPQGEMPMPAHGAEAPTFQAMAVLIAAVAALSLLAGPVMDRMTATAQQVIAPQNYIARRSRADAQEFRRAANRDASGGRLTMLPALLPHPLLTVILAIVWVLLVNDFSLASVVFGLLLGLVIAKLTSAYWPGRPEDRAIRWRSSNTPPSSSGTSWSRTCRSPIWFCSGAARACDPGSSPFRSTLSPRRRSRRWPAPSP